MGQCIILNNKKNQALLEQLKNNGTTTEPGYALDARYGKTLNDLLTNHKISGDHDARYYTEQEIDNFLDRKASVSHIHQKSQITDFPATLKNPEALTIKLNGSSQGAYDGSGAKEVNVT